ncbi:Flp pilus assembly protein TadG [Nitrobacteraceae bacterium AZCC 1564]
MSDVSPLNRILRRATNFRSAKDGNVAVIFAFSLVPMLLAVGAAVDYTRANNSRTNMQAALDGAALMISKDAASIPENEIQTRGEQYFRALYQDASAQNVSVTVTYTKSGADGSKIVMTGSGSLPTDFLYIAGYPTLDFGASSTTVWGSTKMRVALSLDNTGSMDRDGKLSSMQTAAKGLIDTLSKTSSNPGDVLISIIPFSKDVNANPSNYGASWIDWTDWEAEPPNFVKPSNWSSIGPGSDCPFDLPTTKSRDQKFGYTCTESPTLNSNKTDKIPSTGYICPSIDSGKFNSARGSVYYNGCYTSNPRLKPVNSCSNLPNCTCTGSGSSKTCTQITGYDHVWRELNTPTATPHSTWNGCVTDRNKDWDTKSDAPTTAEKLFYAEQYSLCTLPVMAMSDKWGDLKTQIDNMKAVGNTNQGIGMAWGWLSLLQQDPLPAQAEDANYKYNRIVILLSDGDNTQNRYSTDARTIDGRQKLLCDNAKAAGIEIYTIQVNTDGTATSDVMSYCASDQKTDHFFSVKDESGIGKAFAQIGASLTKLRVAR